jgi:hypothetical protein
MINVMQRLFICSLFLLFATPLWAATLAPGDYDFELAVANKTRAIQ